MVYRVMRTFAMACVAGALLVPCLPTVCSGAEPGEDKRPRWVKRYQEQPPEPWNEWQNSLAPEGDAVAVALASDGTTDYRIVIPAEPSLIDRRAAGELQLWLGKITGAELPIVSDSEPEAARELSVGRTNRLASMRASARTAANLAAIDRVPVEGYCIAVDGERIYLIGGEQLGSLAAVTAFLEEDLGVRWYDAALREGTWDGLTKAINAKIWPQGAYRAPRQADLQARVVPRTVAPGLPIRHLSWKRSYNPWALRNRINGGYIHQYGQHGYATGSFSVHTYHRLVPPKTYFEENPEYYSLIDGKRKWENAQICLSNPAVADAAAKTAAEALARIPQSQHDTRYLVGVSAMDWLGDCQCEECQAIMEGTGGYSGLALTFVNRVAERLVPEYPWVTLTTLAYRQSKQPPAAGLQAHPNVAVRFCTDFGASFTWPYHSFYDTQIADLAEQQQWYTRWQAVSPRMHLWIYPHQYRHALAPMPSIRAVADNLRFFHERQAESAYVQQSIGQDRGREAMRYWIFAKLLWNPERDVEDLMRDFIWGMYGAAAPAVFEYEKLLWDHCTTYTDFSRARNWIYPIHNEEMYRHGFIQKARRILERAEAAAGDAAVRQRVGLLKAGVVYVESVQLYMAMRDSQTPPNAEHYLAVADELRQLGEDLDVQTAGFYDGTRTVGTVSEWVREMRKVYQRRFDQRYLPQENWGDWTFRWDPDDRGVENEWFAAEVKDPDRWLSVDVPAFLADTPAENAFGFGWYRTAFTLPESQVGKPVELQFAGVDEQAWVHVNGKFIDEHTLESEFMVGQEVTVADLWNRPFTVTVPAHVLEPGKNVLVVRIHNSAHNAGIHQPVRIYLPDVAFRDLCDGRILAEDFEAVAAGGIPAGWKRHIQQRDGQVFGIAEVSHHFVRHATLYLRDQRSHVAVWTASDDVLPERDTWTIQLDFRLTGGLVYNGSDAGEFKAADAGALIGLKRGERREGEFLPLAQLDNGERAGQPVTLLGLGQVIATDVVPDRWHRLVIRRDGNRWEFYLDDELEGTVDHVDTDLRGLAFGSFRDWPHRAEDVHYANLKIGNFINPDNSAE